MESVPFFQIGSQSTACRYKLQTGTERVLCLEIFTQEARNPEFYCSLSECAFLVGSLCSHWHPCFPLVLAAAPPLRCVFCESQVQLF